MKKLRKNIAFQFSLLFIIHTLNAQFAPAAGYPGSSAFPKDSSIFVEWANACSIQRGYLDIAVPDSGYATVGDGSSAIGMAGQNGVVALGDGGVATLTFASPIFNGPGFDFAVFENGFYTNSPLAFLEFAFVEVSSDGSNFFRFPATSNIQDTSQMPMTGVDCALVNNLAGKYVFGYGTPFDLEELKNENGLDVNHITHVRLIDVIGSVNNQYATYDQYGRKINDAYPTPFSSGGFDLDAVGVIHSAAASSAETLELSQSTFRIYPNPISQEEGCSMMIPERWSGNKLKVYDLLGNIVYQETISIANSYMSTTGFAKGAYFFSFGNSVAKVVVQ
jgi:hypothetical protein